MTTTTDTVALKILSIIEGDGDVEDLAKQYRLLADSVGDTNPEVQALAGELEKLAADKGAIEKFERFNRELDQTEKNLAEAKREVAFLRDGMQKAGSKGAKLFAKDLDKAKKTVVDLAEKQRRYQQNLKGLTVDMQAAGVSTKNLASEQKKISDGFEDAKKKAKQYEDGLKEAEKETEKFARAQTYAAKESARLQNEVGKARARAAKPLPDNTTALRSGIEKTTGALRQLGGVIKGFLLYQLGRMFIGANTAAESLSKGLELVTGSAEAAAEEMQFVRQTANQLGIDVVAAGEAYLGLAAAAKGTALEGEETRRIFVAVSNAMGRLGKSSADTEGALLALQQMISKGKVSAEELRGQLGERLPGAFQTAARAMGVTTAQLEEMLKSGELVAEDLLPRLADELDRTFDTGERIDSFTASWNRFKNTVSGAFQAVEGSAGIMGALGAVMETVGTTINFVVVGFVTLAEKAKATATAIGALWDLLSRQTGLLDFRRRVKEAFDEADAAIAKAADSAFSLGGKLEGAGTSGKTAGEKTATAMEKAASETESAAAAATTAQEAYDELSAAMKALDVDLEEVTTGLNKNSRDLIVNFTTIATSVEASGAAILASYQAAIAKTDDVRTLTELTRLMNVALEEQGLSAETAGKAHESLGARIEKVGSESKQATGAVKALRGALQGIEEIDTAHELLNIAQQLQHLYKVGKITSAELAAGMQRVNDRFAEMGQAAYDSIAEMRKSFKEGEQSADDLAAAVHGINDELDDMDDKARDAVDSLGSPQKYSDALAEALRKIGEDAGLSGDALREFVEDNLAAVWRAWQIGGGALEKLLEQLRRKLELIGLGEKPPTTSALSGTAVPAGVQLLPQDIIDALSQFKELVPAFRASMDRPINVQSVVQLDGMEMARGLSTYQSRIEDLKR